MIDTPSQPRPALAASLRQMKFMPQVHFRADTAIDEASHIEAILRSPAVARDLQGDGEAD